MKKPQLKLVVRKLIEFPQDIAERIEKYRQIKGLPTYKMAVIELIEEGYKSKEVEVDEFWKNIKSSR